MWLRVLASGAGDQHDERVDLADVMPAVRGAPGLAPTARSSKPSVLRMRTPDERRRGGRVTTRGGGLAEQLGKVA